MARGERWSELKGRIAGSWATPAVLIAPLYGLYAYVALTSPGFDDEFYNIRWVEEYGASIISFVQTVDVHPPLSYTLNYLLYELTGSWSLVRLASATLAVGVYYWALRKVAGAFGFNALLVFYVFLCLSPGLLMHLTSVRWYAYALPLLIWLTFIPEPVDAKWAKFAFGFLVLSYLTYAAYILCLPYFYLYWVSDNAAIREKLKRLLPFGTFAVLLHLPQVYFFLSVHLPNLGSQPDGVFSSVIAYLMVYPGNFGIFPISSFAIIASVGLLTVYMLIAYEKRWVILHNYLLRSYLLGLAGFFLSGLAAKSRNLMLLFPLHTVWLLSASEGLNRKRIFSFGVVLVLCSNIAGIHNVAKHENTIKNSWNLPVAELLESLAERDIQNTLVYSHEPVSTYHLEKRGFDVYGPHVNLDNRRVNDLLERSVTAETVAVIKSFRGGISENRYETIFEKFGALSDSASRTYTVGYDQYFRIKRWLREDYPAHHYQVSVYKKQGNAAAGI